MKINEKAAIQFCDLGTCGNINKHSNYKLRNNRLLLQ